MGRQVFISVKNANVSDFESDVLVLKFAQGLHGADASVYEKLQRSGVAVGLPSQREWRTVETNGVIAPKRVVFVGVPPLYEFDYLEIREFARTAVSAAATEVPDAEEMTITLHGPGYGLDEMEAFDSEVAGLLDGLRTGRIGALKEITFVEKNQRRAARLTERLASLLPDGEVLLDAQGQPEQLSESSREAVRNAGHAARKPRVFVAMPFHEEMEDVYDFGIFRPSNECGFVCERADREIFTDDIVQWIKERIATADLVVADVTGANPNVYLEVGYAWGLKKRTLLVVRDPNDLRFDIRGQKCLIYNSIRDLEKQLRSALTAFRDSQ